MAVITLTTDFGWADYYVGAMKGVILQIAPEAVVVDITHDIAPGNILSGALILREIWRAFPAKTIHVAVVDPGVGSERNILLAQYAEQLFLVPDNGLITLIHQTRSVEQINIVSNETLFCKPVSATFHGRDIFAPVAAHLSKGLKPDQVGPRTTFVNLLDVPPARLTAGGSLVGQIIHVDRFGNLVSNISADQLRELANNPTARMQVNVGKMPVGSVGRTFSQAERGKPVAYIGSAGLLEIAVNQGRADTHFAAHPGTTVEVI